MTPLPDDHFQKAFARYRPTPPAGAWTRIESGLERKRRLFPTIALAAGILLLMILLRIQTSSTFKPTDYLKPDEQSAITAVHQPPMTAYVKPDAPVLSTTVQPGIPARIYSKKPRRLDGTMDTPPVLPVADGTSSGNEIILSSPADTASSDLTDEKKTTGHPVFTERPSNDGPASFTPASTKIIYPSAFVNARFLKPTNEPHNTATSPVKGKRNKILVTTGTWLANGNPYGDLRQWKNDFFNLPFKAGSKQKSNSGHE